jgi:hypothetical protein
MDYVALPPYVVRVNYKVYTFKAHACCVGPFQADMLRVPRPGADTWPKMAKDAAA